LAESTRRPTSEPTTELATPAREPTTRRPSGNTGGVIRRKLLPRALSLRTRFTLFLGLTAFVTSTALTVLTFTTARSYLLDQRSSVAQGQTFANASAALNGFRFGVTSDDIRAFINSVRTDDDGFALIYVDGHVYPKNQATPESFPAQLIAQVLDGQTGQQRFSLNGKPYLAVGVSIRSINAQYFEAYSLSNTDYVIRVIGTALVIGSIVITLLAAALGWWASRRLLKPVSRVAAAAGGIASGGLHTRLTPESDPELNRLAQSFNDMADTMQSRIEREAQFASDVSHELRSPITALSAAVEVLDARRADLPDRTQQALDVVVDQVRRFDQMVLDLLELSRIDAGVTDINREELHLDEIVRRIAQRYGFADVPVDVDPSTNTNIWIDKLRLERILANLLDNARHHGGGPTRINIAPDKGGGLLMSVEDSGPGVARGERQRIFERFARGTAARHRVGTGLGLALVAEHAQALGGDAWVEDKSGGGARFVVRLVNEGPVHERAPTERAVAAPPRSQRTRASR
jgi:two-component system sensor histidine kinase MtrB